MKDGKFYGKQYLSSQIFHKLPIENFNISFSNLVSLNSQFLLLGNQNNIHLKLIKDITNDKMINLMRLIHDKELRITLKPNYFQFFEKENVTFLIFICKSRVIILKNELKDFLNFELFYDTVFDFKGYYDNQSQSNSLLSKETLISSTFNKFNQTTYYDYIKGEYYNIKRPNFSESVNKELSLSNSLSMNDENIPNINEIDTYDINYYDINEISSYLDESEKSESFLKKEFEKSSLLDDNYKSIKIVDNIDNTISADENVKVLVFKLEEYKGFKALIALVSISDKIQILIISFLHKIVVDYFESVNYPFLKGNVIDNMTQLIFCKETNYFYLYIFCFKEQ